MIADEEVTDSAVRRLLNDAGDDINDLMTLCEADITSKNQVRKQRFLDNFKMVREKLVDLQDRDYKRLLQPCIDGNEIMEMFQLKPCREVGVLKQYLKDAVLDNKVANEREPLMELLMKKAQDMGLNMAENLNREYFLLNNGPLRAVIRLLFVILHRFLKLKALFQFPSEGGIYNKV